MRRAAAAVLAALLVAFLATPARASVTGWQRNHAAPTTAYHCTQYNDGSAAFLRVCVVISAGGSWQPALVYHNVSLTNPSVVAPAFFYDATSANPGVWLYEGDCGSANNVATGEWTICFGPSRTRGTLTVQSRVIGFEADATGDIFQLANGYSPSYP